MPKANCRWPTCAAILDKPGYCPDHAHHAGDTTRSYDFHKRDAASKQFYNSREWQSARSVKLARDPVCERCGRVLATAVHHIVEVRDVRQTRPDLLTADTNLQSICNGCHARHHKRKGAA
jgi:5-methylcytosine-specific restriction protein A